jgi:hypothetical protein
LETNGIKYYNAELQFKLNIKCDIEYRTFTMQPSDINIKCIVFEF